MGKNITNKVRYVSKTRLGKPASLISLGRSGKANNKSFFGDSPGCYQSYLKYCKKYGTSNQNEIILTEKVFHRERKLRGVYLEKA